MNENTTLLLLDGHNLAYRAFYGLRELSTRDGRPTNAVYAFIRMLEQLRRIWMPTHWCVFFDGGLPAHRTEALPTYKAQRKPMPDPLRAQLPVIDAYLDRAAVPRRRIEGQEADDLIATACGRARAEAGRVLIVSSDKDLFQLVGGPVFMVSPADPGRLIDGSGIEARTGVPPAGIVEWLALTGDTADNIPGIPGVGPKTATALLARFGSLAAVWARLDEVDPPRLREKLRTHRATVERNLEMMRLHADVDGTPDWRACGAVRAPAAALRPFFEDLEFHSLVKELAEPELF